MNSEFRFDIALSFAGNDRPVARELSSALKAASFSVFFDEDFEHELLGQNGADYLRKIYSSNSRYCLVLISNTYDTREWTYLERETMQSRELGGERGFLIPIKIDDHWPDWLPQTRIYFDLRSRPAQQLVNLLQKRRALDLQKLPVLPSQSKIESIDVSGRWTSDEQISAGHIRKGTIEFTQHGNEVSGNAIFEETFHQRTKKLTFDVRGSVDPKTRSIRFTSALVPTGANDAAQYSVDSFLGRFVSPDRIEGTCTDERGMHGRFTLAKHR